MFRSVPADTDTSPSTTVASRLHDVTVSLTATESEQPLGLLAMLHSKGLVPQAEVAVTQSIAWLCATSPDGNPLADLILDAGLTPGQGATWYAEVMAPDKTRTDLECWWDDLPCVVMEAKLDHALTEEQLGIYLHDLRARRQGSQDRAILGTLVPEHRRKEATALLRQVLSSEALIIPAVWSYDQVLGKLADQLGDTSDLEQLRRLIQKCEALDIRPFTAEEIAERSPAREPELIRILDAASASFFTGKRVWPSSSQDADFTWRRYVQAHPDGTSIAVGVRQPDPSAATAAWAWIRLHRETYNARGAGNLLKRVFPDRITVRDDGSTWLPLKISAGLSGTALESEITDQLRDILDVLGPGEDP
jgi:hypothetical protein